MFFILIFVIIKKLGLSNMCNIAHIKTTKSSNFFIKHNNYLLKIYTFNIKRICSNVNLQF
jgi:hypothetical protein